MPHTLRVVRSHRANRQVKEKGAIQYVGFIDIETRIRFPLQKNLRSGGTGREWAADDESRPLPTRRAEVTTAGEKSHFQWGLHEAAPSFSHKIPHRPTSPLERHQLILARVA